MEPNKTMTRFDANVVSLQIQLSIDLDAGGSRLQREYCTRSNVECGYCDGDDHDDRDDKLMMKMKMMMMTKALRLRSTECAIGKTRSYFSFANALLVFGREKWLH